jgi:hypothetical protein
MGEPSNQVFEDHREVFVGRIANCAVVVWRTTPTVDSASLAAKHFGAFELTPGHGFALIAVVTPNCAPVGQDVRHAFDTAMRAHRDAAMGMAAVIEVQGVLGGLTRAMARTMSIVARSPFPVNTYATVDAACKWLSPVLAQRGALLLDPPVIGGFVEQHRRFG